MRTCLKIESDNKIQTQQMNLLMKVTQCQALGSVLRTGLLGKTLDQILNSF